MSDSFEQFCEEMDNVIVEKELGQVVDEKWVDTDDNDDAVLTLPTFPAIDKVLSFMRARLEIPEREQQENIVAAVPHPAKNNISVDSKDIVVALPPSTPVVIEIATVVTVKSEESTQQSTQSLTRLIPVPVEVEPENIHIRVDNVVTSSGRKKKHVLASMLARQYIRTMETTTTT